MSKIIPQAVSVTAGHLAGVINTSTGNILGLLGTLSGTPSANNMVNGPFNRTYAASRTASGTYDNTTLKTYLDGALFTSSAHSSGGQLKTKTGSTIIGVSPGTAEYLDGNLSIVMIYNRPLTSTEIIQNYQATREKFEQWFDCGSGCALYNYDPSCTHC